MSLVEDDVSSRKMPLSATLIRCSVLRTLPSISRLVTISVAKVDGAIRQPRVAARIPSLKVMKVLHLREVVAGARQSRSDRDDASAPLSAQPAAGDTTPFRSGQ